MLGGKQIFSKYRMSIKKPDSQKAATRVRQVSQFYSSREYVGFPKVSHSLMSNAACSW